MAIQHHPLSNAELGEFYYAETEVIKEGLSPAIFTTLFIYEHGLVKLDTKWNYSTTIHTNKKDVAKLAGGNPITLARNSVSANTTEANSISSTRSAADETSTNNQVKD